MGHEAQRRMMASAALVIGVSGLGVEISKNCILAGIHSLMLCDPTPANWFDLGGNFYLNETSIGKPRAEVCKDPLAQLNPYVNVRHATVPDLSMESLAPLVEGNGAIHNLTIQGGTWNCKAWKGFMACLATNELQNFRRH